MTKRSDNGARSLEHRLDRNFRALVLAIAFLVLGGTAEYVSFQNEQDDQRVAQSGECLRVQRLREQVNVTTISQHHADDLIASVLGQPGLVRLLPTSERVDRIDGANQLRTFANQLLIGLPTNCGAAVDHPTSYKSPIPVPYGKTTEAERRHAAGK